MNSVIRFVLFIVVIVVSFYLIMTALVVFLVLVAAGFLFWLYMRYFGSHNKKYDTRKGVTIDQVPSSNRDVSEQSSASKLDNIDSHAPEKYAYCQTDEYLKDYNPYSGPAHSFNQMYQLLWGQINFDYEMKVNDYQLVSNGQVLCKGKLRKTDMGSVADNGIFSLLSKPNEELSSKLHVFDEEGKSIFTFKFTANTSMSGLSATGKFAAVTTNNSGTDHSGQLFFFDIFAKKLLWQVDPVSGNCPFKIYIDEQNEFITVTNSVHDKYVLKYTYDFDGNFLDTGKMRADVINSGSPYALYVLYESEAKALCSSAMAEMPGFTQHLIDLTSHTEADSQLRAKMHRVLGELHEANNNPESALGSYESAISLDAKVGVKRKITKLQKIIAS